MAVNKCVVTLALRLCLESCAGKLPEHLELLDEDSQGSQKTEDRRASNYAGNKTEQLLGPGLLGGGGACAALLVNTYVAIFIPWAICIILCIFINTFMIMFIFLVISNAKKTKINEYLWPRSSQTVCGLYFGQMFGCQSSLKPCHN